MWKVRRTPDKISKGGVSINSLYKSRQIKLLPEAIMLTKSQVQGKDTSSWAVMVNEDSEALKTTQALPN